MNILTNLNLTGNQILNARLQHLAVQPADAKTGQIYYNTASNRAFICVDESAQTWVPLSGKTWEDVLGSDVINKINTEGVLAISMDRIEGLKDALEALEGKSHEQNTDLGTSSRTFYIGGVDGAVIKLTDEGKLEIENIKATSVETGSVKAETANIGNLSVTGTVDFNNNKLANVAAPSHDNDAATKHYVDSVANGLDPKQSVRVATGENVELTGLQEIDGITVVAGDRILVKSQTNAVENGIYVANAEAWTRSADAVQGHLSAGASVYVEEGTKFGRTGWVLISVNNAGTRAINVGTDEIVFTQNSGAGTYLAGKGLSLDGNRFNVEVDGVTIKIVEGKLIANASSEVADIKELLKPETWVEIDGVKVLPMGLGGTGAKDAEGARTNLGATGKHTEKIGDTVAKDIVVTHGLKTEDVTVSLYDVASKQLLIADVEILDENKVKVSFASAPALNAIKVVVVG